MLPLLTESIAEFIDDCQVVIAEQTPPAQSAVEVVEVVVPLLPQPANSNAPAEKAKIVAILVRITTPCRGVRPRNTIARSERARFERTQPGQIPCLTSFRNEGAARDVDRRRRVLTMDRFGAIRRGLGSRSRLLPIRSGRRYALAQPLPGHTSATLALEVSAKVMERTRDIGARMDALVRGADWAEMGRTPLP